MGMHTIWSRYLPEINITPIVIVTQQYRTIKKKYSRLQIYNNLGNVLQSEE